MTDCNPNKVPLKTSVNLDEIAARLPRTPHPEVASFYAQLIDVLMLIAINTQPLIAQPANALARFMTTANSELYVLAPKECCATSKALNLGKSFGVHRVLNFLSCLARSMLIQMQVGQTSYHNAKALSAV
jgi:hypothetical protein